MKLDIHLTLFSHLVNKSIFKLVLRTLNLHHNNILVSLTCIWTTFHNNITRMNLTARREEAHIKMIVSTHLREV